MRKKGNYTEAVITGRNIPINDEHEDEIYLFNINFKKLASPNNTARTFVTNPHEYWKLILVQSEKHEN